MLRLELRGTLFIAKKMCVRLYCLGPLNNLYVEGFYGAYGPHSLFFIDHAESSAETVVLQSTLNCRGLPPLELVGLRALEHHFPPRSLRHECTPGP